MPILLFLSIAVQAYFYYHALKNTCCSERWVLYILWMPGIGPLLYFILIYLPMEMTQTEKAQLKSFATNIIDPHREMKAARMEHDRSPTVQNKHRLASVFIATHQPEEAIPLLLLISGMPMGHEAAVYADLAQAYSDSGKISKAREALSEAKGLADGSHKMAEIDLLAAKIEEQAGNLTLAENLYQSIIDSLPGQEVRCRLATLLLRQDRANEAKQYLYDAIERIRLAPPIYRKQQKVWDRVARDLLKQAA